MLGTINEERFRLRDLNFRLIIYVIVLSMIGILVVYSATINEKSTSLVSTYVKQIMGVGAGIILMIAVSILDYKKMLRHAWIPYVFAILLLVYLLLFGREIYGAKRWYYFPLLGTIQPSEFAKPALIFFLAFVASRLKEKISAVWGILLFFLSAMPLVFLVIKEPDLSTTIMLLLITVCALFIAGVSYKWIVAFILIMIPVCIFAVIMVYQPEQTLLNKVLEPHQVERINAYFFPEQFPEKVYQQSTSVMAIGSGGLFGKGLNTSSLESVKNGNFLSEESSDFIFAVIGEELGFFGSCVIILLVALIVFECFHTAARCNDTTGKIIAGTVGAMFALQSFINMGVALLLLPNTGIPLPFVSAGMSSLLSSFLLIGMVLSVSLWGRKSKRGSFS
ncbi:MAG: FtsW/RodA/SpoVE family cell cycle protein [Lachnospiraceae bacterium]|nr:FtsW/RodA/SpoVE family cell cycle protein [Lachnospiraceae bacterium]